MLGEEAESMLVGWKYWGVPASLWDFSRSEGLGWTSSLRGLTSDGQALPHLCFCCVYQRYSLELDDPWPGFQGAFP